MCFLAPGTGTQYWDRQAGHWQMDTQRMITTHHTHTVATVITINNLEIFSSCNTFVWWFFKVHWVVYCWQWDKISTVLWNVVWLCVCGIAIHLIWLRYTGGSGARDRLMWLPWCCCCWLSSLSLVHLQKMTHVHGCKRKRPSSNIWLSPQASASSIDWPV